MPGAIVRSRTWHHVDIIIEVCHVPLEAWRIGYDTELVLIELRHAAYNLKNHHPASRLGNPPMDRTDPVIQSNQVQILQGILHLIYCRELGKDPRHKLHVTECLIVTLGVISLVITVARKEEQACGKPCFVHPFHNERLVLGIDANVSINRLILKAILAGWRI
jgi:hypothetical protein